MGEGRSVVERFYSGFNDDDIDAGLEVVDPEVQTTEPSSGTTRGVESFRGFIQAFKGAMPDARLNAKNVVEGDDMVVVEGTFTGTFTRPLMSPQGEIPPTGKSFELPYMDVFEIRGGKITHHRTYYDQVSFMQQLGVGGSDVESNEGGYLEESDGGAG